MPIDDGRLCGSCGNSWSIKPKASPSSFWMPVLGFIVFCVVLGGMTGDKVNPTAVVVILGIAAAYWVFFVRKG